MASMLSRTSSLIVSEPSPDNDDGLGGVPVSWICSACPVLPSCEELAQPVCGLSEGPLRDQWELHHTVQVTDTPAAYPFGMLLASRLSVWCSFGPSSIFRSGRGLGIYTIYGCHFTMRPDA